MNTIVKVLSDVIEYIWGVKRQRSVLGGACFYIAHVVLWVFIWAVNMLFTVRVLYEIKLIYDLTYIPVIIGWVFAIVLLWFYGLMLSLTTV